MNCSLFQLLTHGDDCDWQLPMPLSFRRLVFPPSVIGLSLLPQFGCGTIRFFACLIRSQDCDRFNRTDRMVCTSGNSVSLSDCRVWHICNLLRLSDVLYGTSRRPSWPPTVIAGSSAVQLLCDVWGFAALL